MTPPAAHYEPSLRPMPDRPRALEYGDELVVRQVAPNGRIKWKGAVLYLTHLLGSQPVGLKEIDNDEWELFYGPLLIGYVLVREGKPRVEPVS